MKDLNSKIKEYVQKRKTDPRYYPGLLGLNVVQGVFKKNSESTNIEKVLLKVAVLNDLYHTHLTAPVKMAKHIVSITDLDEKIKMGSPDAVTKISKITMSGTSEKDLYIFATKYCFMANPKMYFIYDPIVHKQLIRYLNLPLDESTRLNEYEFFASKMQELIKRYKIKASHIDLDTFLWIEGHEEFSHKIF